MNDQLYDESGGQEGWSSRSVERRYLTLLHAAKEVSAAVKGLECAPRDNNLEASIRFNGAIKNLRDAISDK